MSNHFTIGELSTILGIEKSTLRYWEKQGLIDLERNDGNNYREYSKNAVIEISDIAFYRSINMPIKKLKEINTMQVSDFKSTLSELEQSITEEMIRLEDMKRNVKRRLKHIEKYYELSAHPFQFAKPDIDRMAYFEVHDQRGWKTCMYDPYQYCIFIGEGCEEIINGYAIQEIDIQQDNVIWSQSDSTSEYVTCIVAFASGHYEENTLDEVKTYFNKHGWRRGAVVGRYLFSSYVDKKYDIHKVWIEVKR